MKVDLFQSCDHWWVFLICWHIECSTFTASLFKIWNSSSGIPSPPLTLFVVALFTWQSNRTTLFYSSKTPLPYFHWHWWTKTSFWQHKPYSADPKQSFTSPFTTWKNLDRRCDPERSLLPRDYFFILMTYVVAGQTCNYYMSALLIVLWSTLFPFQGPEPYPIL